MILLLIIDETILLMVYSQVHESKHDLKIDDFVI